MAHYLVQVAYTAEAWAAMMKNPQDRAEAVEGAIKKLGGKMERFWMSFGEFDIIGILDMPNNVAAAAFAMAVAAGGACRNVKTTPLLTTRDGVEALKQAATSGYKPATVAASDPKGQK
ncbi:MAG: GYD domain-containing protein [Bryobacteraceae bacterium]